MLVAWIPTVTPISHWHCTCRSKSWNPQRSLRRRFFHLHLPKSDSNAQNILRFTIIYMYSIFDFLGRDMQRCVFACFMADFGYSRFNVPNMNHLRATLLQRCIFQSCRFWTCATPTNPVGTLKWRRRSDASGSSGTGAETVAVWGMGCCLRFSKPAGITGIQLRKSPCKNREDRN
jgi:hypothetical protein